MAPRGRGAEQTPPLFTACTHARTLAKAAPSARMPLSLPSFSPPRHPPTMPYTPRARSRFACTRTRACMCVSPHLVRRLYFCDAYSAVFESEIDMDASRTLTDSTSTASASDAPPAVLPSTATSLAFPRAPYM